MTERQQQLLAAIEDAFRGVELGDGVSLHQTIAIDCYQGLEAERAARVGDEKHDWRKLIRDPELARIVFVGGLCFYDATGLRFHLPAYLALVVDDDQNGADVELLWSLVFNLTHFSEHNVNRCTILDAAQRKCVGDVLLFIRDEYDTDRDEIDRAIAEFWGVEPPAPTCA